MMNSKKAIALCLGFTFLLVVGMHGQGTSAMIDPSFRFSTIETEHFSIHYHQGTEEIAGRVATFAEDILGSPLCRAAERLRNASAPVSRALVSGTNGRLSQRLIR
ncbi:MAG: hypothetical protein ACM34I_11130 [bacterium]